MACFSPPHHESDSSRTPPFPIAARKNISFGSPTSGTSVNNSKSACNSSPHGSVSINNQSHHFIPIQSSSPASSSSTLAAGRIPTTSMVSGRAQVLGDNGVVLQSSSALMGVNGAYPSSSVPSQFGHGTSLALNNGEEGNNNLMWLLDFKLDFFNDADAGNVIFI